MARVQAAIPTDVAASVAASIDALLARYRLARISEPLVVEGGAVNQNFRVETDGGPRFVRLHAAATSGESIALEHRVIDWAAARGIPVNPPCLAVDGTATQAIDGRCWSLFPWLEPLHVRLDRLDARAAMLLGATLGQLQATLHDFADPVFDQRESDLRWQTARAAAVLEAVAAIVRADMSLGDEQAEIIAALALQQQVLLAQARPDSEFAAMTVQPLHGDYHERNVIIDRHGGVRAVIDWEMVRRKPRVYELLRSLAFMDLLDSPLLDAYLGGYRQHVRLAGDECEQGVAFWWQRRLHTTWAYRSRFIDGDRRTHRFLKGNAEQLRRWADPAARAALAQHLRTAPA
jgi:Ser/Thr protein kinase RdoA (MazF antagonist)